MPEQEKSIPHKPVVDVTPEELLHTLFGDPTVEPEFKLSPEEQEGVDRLEAEARRARVLRRAGLPPETKLPEEELTRLEDETTGILKLQIESAIDSLNPRERLVVELRFGLEDGRSRTLNEVGQEIGRSKSTAWRIEQSALRKLKHPARAARLQDYLESQF